MSSCTTTGAGVTQALQKELSKITDPNLRLLVSSLVGSTAAKLVGGDGLVGGFTGYIGTKFNDEAHQPTTPGAIVMIDGVFYQNDENGNPVKMENPPSTGTVFWASDEKYYVLDGDGKPQYFYKPGTIILQDGQYWEANSSGTYNYHDSVPAGTMIWSNGNPIIVDGSGKHWPADQYPGEQGALKQQIHQELGELFNGNEELLSLLLFSRDIHLPKSILAKDKNGTIEHYYPSGDHGPAHVHITDRKGNVVKVGQNGKPLKGEQELNREQQTLVEENLNIIRKTIDVIMKWYRNN